jgi:hypothetical protein
MSQITRLTGLALCGSQLWRLSLAIWEEVGKVARQQEANEFGTMLYS